MTTIYDDDDFVDINVNIHIIMMKVEITHKCIKKYK